MTTARWWWLAKEWRVKFDGPSPAGIFVVDAKAWEGLIRVRDVGGLFRTDRRLFVGRRDASKVAAGLGWQVDAVRAVVERGRISPMPSITPVLCFVGAEWPLLRRPTVFESVHLESERSIAKLLTASNQLDARAIDQWTELLARELPAK